MAISATRAIELFTLSKPQRIYSMCNYERNEFKIYKGYIVELQFNGIKITKAKLKLIDQPDTYRWVELHTIYTSAKILTEVMAKTARANSLRNSKSDFSEY